VRDTKYVFAHTGKTSTAKAAVCTQLFFYVFLRQFAPRVYVRIFLEQNAIGKIMPKMAEFAKSQAATCG
jgi:hypothetical protein